MEEKLAAFLEGTDPGSSNGQLIKKQFASPKITTHGVISVAPGSLYFSQGHPEEQDLIGFIWSRAYYFNGKYSIGRLKSTTTVHKEVRLDLVTTENPLSKFLLARGIFRPNHGSGLAGGWVEGQLVMERSATSSVGVLIKAFQKIDGSKRLIHAYDKDNPPITILLEDFTSVAGIDIPRKITLTAQFWGKDRAVDRVVTFEVESIESKFVSNPVRSLFSELKEGDAVLIEGDNNTQTVASYFKGNAELEGLLPEHEPIDHDLRPADTVLAEARDAAKSQGKNIFVLFSATWCAPCKWFKEALAKEPWASVLDRNYVFVTLRGHEEKPEDANAGATQLFDLWTKGQSGGIPFYAVLDADGKLLMTAHEMVNGTPMNRTGISGSEGRHLLEVLRATAPSIHEIELRMLDSIVNEKAIKN